jgi:hypothetical protein
MKKIIISLFLVVSLHMAQAQNLLDIYKKGTVKLVPDNSYAQGNDWNKVFKTYYDTIYNTPMGSRKSLEMMPDGSVVVNHRYRNYYTKFSPAGKFEKEFGVMKSNGQQYKEVNAIEGVINNNTFFTGLDNMGNMLCFDFDGHYKKTLKLNYMTWQMVPMPNNKIAVVGWAIWETKFRDFVAIVDYETNKEKVIWDYFTARPSDFDNGERKLFNYYYKFKKGGMISSTTMPYSKNLGLESRLHIACVGNKLILSNPINGEIRIYDLEGNLISTDQIEWVKGFISLEEQKEIQKKAIENYRKNEQAEIPSDVTPDIREIMEEHRLAYKSMVKEMEVDLNRIKDPIPLPFFSTVLKDTDGNLLYFEYAKEENANKFNVWIYESGGKFLCQSSFVCDDYNLEINPSKMVFHNGYIYGLQLLKNATGVPLRLVRFKLTNP